MTATDTSQRIYFKNLDVLRFIAAYMIVILHCFFGWRTHFGHPDFIAQSPDRVVAKLENIIGNFSFGVDIFFIISGFLITYLLLSEQEKTGKVDVLRFYIRRAFRIWPLYFLILLIGPLLTYFYNEQSPNYLLQFLFLGNFDIIMQGTKSVATDHLWSICIEEHFYIFCPLFIAFIPTKKLPQVLLTIVFCSMLFRAFTAMYGHNYGSDLYVNTLSRIDVLALGSLFGYLCYHKKLSFNDPWPVRLIFYSAFLFMFFNVSYTECDTILSASIKKYFFVLIAAYWVGNFMFNPGAQPVSSRVRPLQLFGKVSYGIYMFNPIIIYVILQTFSKLGYQNYGVFLLLVHAALALVTFLSYRFYEMPFLNLKEKYAVIKSGGELKRGALSVADTANETVGENVNATVQAVTVTVNTEKQDPEQDT